MLLISNSIVYSQTTLNNCDTLKCFTYSEARKIFTDLSRIPHLNNIIVNQDSIISNNEKEIELHLDKIDLQTDIIKDKDRQIVKIKRRSKFFIIFGAILGLSTQLIF